VVDQMRMLQLASAAHTHLPLPPWLTRHPFPPSTPTPPPQVKMAQAPISQNQDYTAVQQEQWLRQEALQCVSSAAESLLSWYNKATAGQLTPDDDACVLNDWDG